ncbi:uncharacterized protein Eint_061280 [Encephalitozoon intestinalis ATCC 50506]|uniref:Polyprenol reductase n=1 Tax=Encephalitozoon intestinalis (strain ATCC 50506) TaxID=876142 RepID=E0S7Q4_ENCIT|nr:uncharacterized protein Eint_061280 [Encephalitozoon intestinalis ATCC 50506]ADM11733.1 hypothetical protein Eint_061280 [Encephalitozoon intestinalis ATCC 50506]UTX45472.1 hypothetical protein GPK93_06g10290 [Encephalitozoon intestinalis]
MFVLVETVYFILLPIVTVASHMFMNNLTRHGHIPQGISKNNYQYFYAYGLILSLLLPMKNIYPLHLGRRLAETKVFKYSNRSKMSILHFIHGLLYYTFVCAHLRNKRIGNVYVFLFLNILQLVSHYYVFVRKTFVYTHYIVEVMIYGFICWEVRTIQMLFNLLYVLSFVFSTIMNRRTCRSKIFSK